MNITNRILIIAFLILAIGYGAIYAIGPLGQPDEDSLWQAIALHKGQNATRVECGSDSDGFPWLSLADMKGKESLRIIVRRSRLDFALPNGDIIASLSYERKSGIKLWRSDAFIVLK